MNCGVPQGSILGSLLLLLHVNDISQALSNSHTCQYTDDTSFLYQHKDVTKIESALNKGFAKLRGWFVDNKLSIHFVEDKTKFNLFSWEKNLPELNIT